MIKRMMEDTETRQNKTESKEPLLHYLPEKQPYSWRERLSRNLALSGMLVLTIVAVRNAQLPSGETVLTGVQNIIDQSWGDGLGKISFVSRFFPESMAVFFEGDAAGLLTAPCSGSLSHAWNAGEPYLGYESAGDGRIYAPLSGQVMSLAHGNDEEKIVRIRGQDGLEVICYALREIYVREGDQVTEKSCIGCGDARGQVLIEVKRNGLPIDPSGMMAPRSEAGL